MIFCYYSYTRYRSFIRPRETCVNFFFSSSKLLSSVHWRPSFFLQSIWVSGLWALVSLTKLPNCIPCVSICLTCIECLLNQFVLFGDPFWFVTSIFVFDILLVKLVYLIYSYYWFNKRTVKYLVKILNKFSTDGLYISKQPLEGRRQEEHLQTTM